MAHLKFCRKGFVICVEPSDRVLAASQGVTEKKSRPNGFVHFQDRW